MEEKHLTFDEMKKKLEKWSEKARKKGHSEEWIHSVIRGCYQLRLNRRRG